MSPSVNEGLLKYKSSKETRYLEPWLLLCSSVNCVNFSGSPAQRGLSLLAVISLLFVVPLVPRVEVGVTRPRTERAPLRVYAHAREGEGTSCSDSLHVVHKCGVSVVYCVFSTEYSTVWGYVLRWFTAHGTQERCFYRILQCVCVCVTLWPGVRSSRKKSE